MSIQPPKTNKGYRPEHAEELDRMVASVDGTDVRNIEEAKLVDPLLALIQVAESALKIGYKRHYRGESEPYPGAAQKVMEQALALIENARKSGLVK